MKKTISLTTLILVLVLFPMINSGAFANFIGNGTMQMNLVADPVNLILLGIGFTFVGTRA